MKLIFENWRKFVKKQKSGVSKQNLELLLKKCTRITVGQTLIIYMAFW